MMPTLTRFPLLAFVCLTLTTFTSGAEISTSDPLLRYVGRFDHTDQAGPRCSWSASSVAFTFSGGSASVKLKDGGKDLWQVVVDGQPTSVLTLESGEKTYPLVTDLPAGMHTVELVKRTEASQGATQLLGLEIDDDARLLATPDRARRIEVIGDSISCGYGNEAASKEENFTPGTENAWLTYGAMAARAVDADYVCIAWSGKKLWPNNSIVSLYDRVAPNAGDAIWDFANPAPEAVVINLGTNDFGRENPEEAGWIAAYVDFIKVVRSHYPQAEIYCALGTMMSDYPATRNPRTTILGYLDKVVSEANAAGGAPVRLLDFGVQNAQVNGLGANWHPSVKTHVAMSEILVAALKQDLGW